MTILSLTYVLICSVSFAALDLLRKLLTGRIAPMALVFFVAVGAIPPMTVWLVVSGGFEVSAGYLLPGLASLVLNFVANLGFVYSLTLSPLSRTIPLLSLTPAFTSLLAVPLLHEIPTLRQGVGIACVVCGAVVLNLDQARAGFMKGIMLASVQEKGSLLMAGVALVWSLAIPLDKMAIAASSSAFHGLLLSVGIAVGAFCYLLARGRGDEIKAGRFAKGLVFALMVCASFGLAFQFLSIQVLLVSLVETFKRAIGCFLAIVFGRIIFRERITLHQMVTITVMVAGVALVLG